MKKKLFIVSLVLSMCFSMLSIVNVQAKETIREDHYVNPIYKDVKSSVVHHDIQTYSLEDVEYTSDQEKLVKIFREKLINRESNIVLYYHCDEEITQEFFSNLVHQLFQKAIKHTGNGKEGDYLKWHCQGWTVKASISVNSNKGYDLNIFYDVSYLSSLEQEEKVDEEVSNLLKSLDLSNKTDYQKVKAIYDYICSNVTYDHDKLNDKSYSLKYTAYAALINKTAVCQGYASLFYRLALDAGVDTRVISGEAGGLHAWNIVKLNGKYYNLDSTWDAGRSTYAYFLKNTNDFDDHVRDNDYQSNEFIEEYPMWDESYTEIDCNKYGHNYSEPIYKWSVDNMTVTAKRICLNNDSHVEEETVTAQKNVKDPTCTENGIITYIANFKNNAFKPQIKIVDDKKATGHKVVVDQAKEATCTEDGLTEGKHCSLCGYVYKKQDIIPAKGHTYVIDPAVEATCTTAGKTEGKHCSTCGYIAVVQKEIPIREHEYKNGVCIWCGKKFDNNSSSDQDDKNNSSDHVNDSNKPDKEPSNNTDKNTNSTNSSVKDNNDKNQDNSDYQEPDNYNDPNHEDRDNVNLDDKDDMTTSQEDDCFKSNNLYYRITSHKKKQVTVLKCLNKNCKSINIPAKVSYKGKTYSVVSIHAKAFSGLKKVKKITIGKNVKTIEKMAFYNCKKLKTVQINATNLKRIDKKAFGKVNGKCLIRVKAKKLSKYKKLLSKGGLNKIIKIKTF